MISFGRAFGLLLGLGALATSQIACGSAAEEETSVDEGALGGCDFRLPGNRAAQRAVEYPGDGKVALTFTGAAGADTDRIVDKLNELGIKGNFFLSSTAGADLSKLSIQQGSQHMVAPYIYYSPAAVRQANGRYKYVSPSATTFPMTRYDERGRADMDAIQAKLSGLESALLGKGIATPASLEFFRFSYPETNVCQPLMDAHTGLDRNAVHWHVVASGSTPEAYADSVITGVEKLKGGIVLLGSTGSKVVDSLETIVKTLREQDNMTFVTLDEEMTFPTYAAQSRSREIRIDNQFTLQQNKATTQTKWLVDPEAETNEEKNVKGQVFLHAEIQHDRYYDLTIRLHRDEQGKTEHKEWSVHVMPGALISDDGIAVRLVDGRLILDGAVGVERHGSKWTFEVEDRGYASGEAPANYAVWSLNMVKDAESCRPKRADQSVCVPTAEARNP